MCGSTPNSNSPDWCWRDTLRRLEYLDTIINEIVRDGIVISAALWAVIGTIFIFLSQHNDTVVFGLMIVISGLGVAISLMTILNLSRQELIRRYYFSNLDKNNPHLPLLPPDDWPLQSEGAKWPWLKKEVIYSWSKQAKNYGYCVLWISVFIGLGSAYFLFAIGAILKLFGIF